MLESHMVTREKPRTAGALRTAIDAGLPRHASVKDELRANLIAKLQNGDTLFPGIIGYDDTVVPQLVNALLSRHNFILLGLRGQAKTRILRALTTLLDEWLPVVPGSEINDDPLEPLSAYGRHRVQAEGDEMPIAWLPRDARYIEKLATPDVTIADMIGDIDPIKAAKSGMQLSNELAMHFGLLPRANRGIFSINELPDLAGKIRAAIDTAAGGGGALVDEAGHGTHVASLACGAAGNGLGIAGAGLDCGLIVAKTDFSDASVARAIVESADRGAHAINLAFGTDGGRAAPAAVSDALQYAAAKGAVLVAAAAAWYATVDHDSAGSDSGHVLRTVLAVGVGLGVAWLLGRHVVRRVGGLTGDVLGALSEVATTACLVVLATSGH